MRHVRAFYELNMMVGYMLLGGVSERARAVSRLGDGTRRQYVENIESERHQQAPAAGGSTRERMATYAALRHVVC